MKNLRKTILHLENSGEITISSGGTITTLPSFQTAIEFPRRLCVNSAWFTARLNICSISLACAATKSLVKCQFSRLTHRFVSENLFQASLCITSSVRFRPPSAIKVGSAEVGIIVYRPHIRQRFVERPEVQLASSISSNDNSLRDVVAPGLHPFAHPPHCKFRTSQRQEDQLEVVTLVAQVLDPAARTIEWQVSFRMQSSFFVQQDHAADSSSLAPP